ncbi:MAG TPA: TonB-dependent receptor [Psychromonas hadalis]|nr:TonB-dependent receptor [Psychromonas hadalis]
MFNPRHTPIALALITLFSTPVFADTETETTQDTTPKNERVNVLVTKGYSSPSATTENYSGDNVIKIIPSAADRNKSLDQLISEQSPGFVHTNSGTKKHNSTNYHRGLSDKYTLYLLNGVPFPTSTLGAQNIPDIPMESIALIEVINGAQASLYGSSSLTGIINIVTKTGSESDAQLNVSAGSHNTQRVGGVYAEKFGRIEFMTSFDADKSDGYDFIEASDDDFGYNTYSMSSYAAYVTKTNRLSFAINNSTSDIDIFDKPFGLPAGKINSKQDNLQLTGKYIQVYNPNVTSEFTLSHATVDLDSGHYNSSVVDTFKTDQNLAQLRFNTQWDLFSLNMGGEFSQSKFHSKSDKEIRDQHAVYAALNSDVTNYLTLSTGIRNDHYSDFGNALTYSAGASLFNTAHLSYRTSFTAPSYNDLYWPNLGNPDLKAEKGEIYELSFTHNISTVDAFIPMKLNFYTGELDDKINWAPVSSGSSIWKPSNVDLVKIKGVEAYVKYDTQQFVFDLSAAYSKSIDESTNNQLVNVPKWSGSSSIQYNLGYNLKPKFIYSYIGEREGKSDTLDEVHLLGFALDYQMTQYISFAFNVDNITNNENQLHEGYNADGRTFLLTVNASL